MSGKMVCDHFGIVIVLLMALCMTKSCFGQVNTTDKTNCSLVPMDFHSISRIKELIEGKNRIIKIELEIEGETGPLGENTTYKILNSKEWFILTEEVSEVILQFPADYLELSLYTFSFHQASLQMSVIQRPENCFSDFSLEEILNTIRFHFLRNFTSGNQESTEFLKICNRFIELSSDNRTGEIKYICCDEKKSDCTILEPGIWNKMFNICLICSKYFLMAICPLFIPKKLYRKFNTTFQCRLDQVYDFVLILKKGETEIIDNSQYEEISRDGNFNKLKECIRELPAGTYSLKVNSIYITVNEKNVVMENEYPVTFTKFWFRNLVLCNMRKELGMDDCCNEPIMTPTCCKWLTCVSNFMFLLVFCILIFPWWLTVIFYIMIDFPYYSYLEELGKLLNITIIKDVRSPSTFNADYACIALFFVLFWIFNKNAKYRKSIEVILKYCLNNKRHIKSELSNLLKKVCFLEKEEMSGGIRCLLISLCFPVWIIGLGMDVSEFIGNLIPLIVVLVNCLLVSIDRKVEKHRSEYLIIILCACQIGLLCNSIFAGFVSIYIECMFYTILGILINYGDVFQYVCLIILFLGYIFNSFHSVSMVFLDFSRQLCQLLQTRLNSCRFSENETHTEVNNQSQTYLGSTRENMLNTCYIVPNGCNRQEKEDYVYVRHGRLKWNVHRLLFFLEETSTCISRNFFHKTSQIKHAAAPGSLSALYVKSFRDFIFVVVFFLFIVVVVFALGKAHDLSVSIQTLLAVGGGVVPFVLQKVFKSRNKDVWPLSNDVWETLVMSEIDAFNETWEVNDLDVTTLDDTQSGEIDMIADKVGNAIQLFVFQEEYDIKKVYKNAESRHGTRLEREIESISSENHVAVENNIQAEYQDVSFERNPMANVNLSFQSSFASHENIELGCTNAACEQTEVALIY